MVVMNIFDFKVAIRRIFTENREIIRELHISGDRDDSNKFIQWENLLILIDDNGKLSGDVQSALENITDNTNMNFIDVNDGFDAADRAREYMLNNYPILVGDWDGDDTITIYAGYDLSQGENSVNVHKVARALGAKYIEITGGAGESYIVPAKRHVDFPDTAYHGTDLKSLLRIMTYGLRPQGRDRSNYADQNIYHKTEVFLTDKLGTAESHAHNAARQSDTSPVIIEFRIPDKRYIQPDYDIDTTHGSTHYRDVRAQSRPSHIDTTTTHPGNPLGKSRDSGIFGYTGHIPASHIVAIFKTGEEDEISGNDPHNYIRINPEKLVENLKSLEEIGYDLSELKDVGLMDLDFLADYVAVAEFVNEYEDSQEDELDEGSRGLKRALRQKQKHGIQKIKNVGSGQIRSTFKDAFNTAQKMNKKAGGKVTVYHMIMPERVEHGRSLDEIFDFLFSKSPNKEISVSVEKGVWNVNRSLVLEGEGKLSMYFPTDVYTTIDDYGNKVPLEPWRDENSHGWDEGTLRLSDVEWNTIYYPDDLPSDWYRELNKMVEKYDLTDKHISDAHYGAIGISAAYQQDFEDLEKQIIWEWEGASEKWNELDRELTSFRKELGDDKFFANYEAMYDQLSEIYDKIPSDVIEVVGERVLKSDEEWLEELQDSLQYMKEVTAKLEKVENEINSVEVQVSEKRNRILEHFLKERSNPEPDWYWLLADVKKGLPEFEEQLQSRPGGINLKGVKGVSGTNKIVWEHAHVRDIAFRMHGKIVRGWNDLEMMKYEDPNYLLNNNAERMIRITNSYDLASFIGKLQNYIVRASTNENFKYKINYSGVINALGYWLKDNPHELNNADDFVKIFQEYMKSDHHAADYARYAMEEVDPVDLKKWVEQGTIDFARLYGDDEEEWVVLNDEFTIPKKKTKVYIKKPEITDIESKISYLEFLGKHDEIQKLIDSPEGFYFNKKRYEKSYKTDSHRLTYKCFKLFKDNGWEVSFVEPSKLQKTQIRYKSRGLSNEGDDKFLEKLYWGDSAAGILPIAQSTGRILVNHRSDAVMEPNTWGVWGGKIDDPDASVKQEAIREFNEESGYNGPIKLINAYVYEDGDFKYYNFLGLIPDEFEPKISLEHQWETQSWEWMSLEELMALHPKHFGLEALLSNSMSLIQDYANEE